LIQEQVRKCSAGKSLVGAGRYLAVIAKIYLTNTLLWINFVVLSNMKEADLSSVVYQCRRPA